MNEKIIVSLKDLFFTKYILSFPLAIITFVGLVTICFGFFYFLKLLLEEKIEKEIKKHMPKKR